tara:strand:+ start:319 stop:486 length:168 start_codon:yes stop_codon:yes gene_type:complete
MSITMIYILLAFAPVAAILIYIGFQDMGWQIMIPVCIMIWFCIFAGMAAFTLVVN